MEGSCTDGSTTSESISMTLTSAGASTPPLPDKSLCRVGSGASVVLDSDGGVEAESRKLPSSRFKGVVAQPNGRWGAQIYEKHQRVWLGTFNEEDEAAKAYDVAAQRFRGRNAVTNFKPLSPETMQNDDAESAFLNAHSKAEIVDMLRKHTYADELEQGKRSYGGGGNKMAFDKHGFSVSSFGSGTDPDPRTREQLFEKAVTPSDVGKLNRLVIPKQHAEKHFPLQNGSTSKGVLLNFEDVGGKVWRFRYSYWNSSQSYVLTKGWSRFVKEKSLKAGDIVSFQRSTGPDKQLHIDWKPKNGNGLGPLVPGSGHMGTGLGSNPVQPVQMVRLFGVNIFKVPGVGGVVDTSSNFSGNANGKRMREMDLLALECSKKQRVVIDAL